jgi:hypothetical protein
MPQIIVPHGSSPLPSGSSGSRGDDGTVTIAPTPAPTISSVASDGSGSSGASGSSRNAKNPTIAVAKTETSLDGDDALRLNLMAGQDINAIEEIGMSGLNRVSGFIYEELLPELRGERGRKQLRMMIDEDPIIGAFRLMIETLCRQVRFDFEAASEKNEDEKAAEFCRGIFFEDMSTTWQDTMSEVLSMVWWGWEWSEVVYKVRSGEEPGTYKDSKGVERTLASSIYDDGKIGIRKLSPRAQETLFRWGFDDRGGIRSMIQLAPPYYRFVELPIEKSALFRTTSLKNNPEGRSVLRNAYTSWYFKRNLQRIEAIGVERDLAGIPIAWMPTQFLSTTADANQSAMAAAMKQMVTNIRRDEQEGLVFPLAYDQAGHKLFDLTLLNSGGSRSFNTSEIINRYDQRIAQSVMAEFIMLGMQNVGSFALASSKTELFAIAIGTFLDMICDVINRHVIRRLFSLNGMKLAARPKLVHGDIESVPLNELAQMITALSGAGMQLFPSPDGDLEKHILEHMGLPAERAWDDQYQGSTAGINLDTLNQAVAAQKQLQIAQQQQADQVAQQSQQGGQQSEADAEGGTSAMGQGANARQAAEFTFDEVQEFVEDLPRDLYRQLEEYVLERDSKEQDRLVANGRNGNGKH